MMISKPILITRNNTLRLGILFLVALSVTPLLATPYWTPEQIAAQEAGLLPVPDALGPSTPPRPPQIEPYNYYTQYLRTADWLVGLQVTTAGADFGGEREGETGSLYTIIQTDNTQECIVVWSNAKRITGIDTLYQQAIANAWIYNRRWPAWLEEGSNGSYYRSHNAGWGIAATMAYITNTQDSSVIGYGDSCANYIMQYPCSGSSNTDRNAEGIATGALARYARWRLGHTNHQRWLDTSLARGQRLRIWIESNPTYALRQAESWALSGGCSFWGVLNSICRENPTWGIGWVNQYGQFMDARPGAGNWANAWGTWYGHGHTDAYLFTGNPMFLDSARVLADYLLDQDTDLDGGIPATVGDPQNQDQSWVSCYMDWMLLDPLMNFSNFPHDLGVSRIDEPATLVVQGDSIRVRFSVVNYGRNPLAPTIEIRFGASETNATVTAQITDTTLSPGLRREYTAFAGVASLPTMFCGVRLTTVDSNSVNDTLAVRFHVRTQRTLPVTVQSYNADTTRISFAFTSMEDPTRCWQIDTVMQGVRSIQLDAQVFDGNWNYELIPSIPFKPLSGTYTVSSAGQSLYLSMQPAFIWLLDDDSSATFETYYQAALDSTLHGDLVRYDRIETVQDLPTDITKFYCVIWFTGNRTTPMDSVRRVAIRNAIANRTALLLTGQNIGEHLSLVDLPLLNRLGASLRTPDANNYRLLGVSGSNWYGVNTLIAGASGANNQNSQDGFNQVNNSTSWVVYQSDIMSNAAVSTVVQNEAKTLLCGFGMEAISSTGNNSMKSMLLDALDWLFPLDAVEKPTVALPQSLSLTAYPNPFNSELTIHIELPQTGRAEVAVFNLAGQEIVRERLQSNNGNTSWTWRADKVASGVYYVKAMQQNRSVMQKVVLLK
ncbi:MAG: T9SS type A sorting domain-containing protein [bacterium]|nr:T9SS type A sorting domain-containing protein [bacterium]